MANWPTDPSWIEPSTINNGNEYTAADGVTASDFNTIVNNMLYLNKLGVKVPQEKAVTVTENGTQEIVPDGDKTLSKVTLTVAVGGPIQQLDTPGNVKATGTTVSWDAVKNATSYGIYADGKYLGDVSKEVATQDSPTQLTTLSTDTYVVVPRDIPASSCKVIVFTYTGVTITAQQTFTDVIPGKSLTLPESITQKLPSLLGIWIDDGKGSIDTQILTRITFSSVNDAANASWAYIYNSGAQVAAGQSISPLLTEYSRALGTVTFRFTNNPTGTQKITLTKASNYPLLYNAINNTATLAYISLNYTSTNTRAIYLSYFAPPVGTVTVGNVRVNFLDESEQLLDTYVVSLGDLSLEGAYVLDGQITVERESVDLTTLPTWQILAAGTYAITIKAKADGYKDSNASAAVSVATEGPQPTCKLEEGVATTIGTFYPSEGKDGFSSFTVAIPVYNGEVVS